MKLRSRLAALLLIGAAPTLHAQSIDQVRPVQDDGSTAPRPKAAVSRNEVKLNISALALGNLSLQYERSLVPGLSVALGVRFGPERGLPFGSTLESAVGDDPSTKTLVTETRMSNYAITPELRYYFGKGLMKGFYAGAFGRFGAYSVKTVLTLSDPTQAGGTRPVPLSGSYSYGGAGLQLGAKWYLSRRISLDWWMLGPMYTTGTLRLDATMDLSSVPASEKQSRQADLRKTFDEATVDNSGIHASTKLGLPGIRSGFALGFRF